MGALTEHQRRAWRIALLVTGDPARADEALLTTLARRVTLAALPQHRRDRLTLICVREIVGEAAVRRPALLQRLRAAHRSRRGVADIEQRDAPAQPFSGSAAPAVAVARELREQPREAWMLHRVLNLELRDVARAMDCSRTAASRHLEEAEKAIGSALGAEYASAIDALRWQSDEARPGSLVEEAIRVQRAARWVGRLIAVLVAVLALTAVVALVLLLMRRAGAPSP